MDNYSELHLPENWKDGDILTDCENNFCVFRHYSVDFPGMFKAYINLGACLQLSDDNPFCLKNSYRLATDDEINFFHSQLHKIDKDWDVKKKQLVNWKWKPKEGDDYWAVIVGITIYKLKLTWNGSGTDKIRYELGNCFRTYDEADAMLTKVKLLFNKE